MDNSPAGFHYLKQYLPAFHHQRSDSDPSALLFLLPWPPVLLRVKCRTSLAASRVISASSSAVGLKFTVVSAKKSGPFFVSIRYMPAIFFTPSSVPIILIAGRIVSG